MTNSYLNSTNLMALGTKVCRTLRTSLRRSVALAMVLVGTWAVMVSSEAVAQTIPATPTLAPTNASHIPTRCNPGALTFMVNNAGTDFNLGLLSPTTNTPSTAVSYTFDGQSQMQLTNAAATTNVSLNSSGTRVQTGGTAGAPFNTTAPNAASNSYTIAAPSGTSGMTSGGTARLFLAEAASPSFRYNNPGVLGADADLSILPVSTGVVKYSHHDFTPGTTVRAKFEINSSAIGATERLGFYVGNGTTFSDNSAMADGEIISGVNFDAGNFRAVTGATPSTFTTGNIFTSLGRAANTTYTIEVYCNNSVNLITFTRNGIRYVLPSQRSMFFINGNRDPLTGSVVVVQNNGTAGTPIKDLCFYTTNSAAVTHTIDNLEYATNFHEEMSVIAPVTAAASPQAVTTSSLTATTNYNITQYQFQTGLTATVGFIASANVAATASILAPPAAPTVTTPLITGCGATVTTLAFGATLPVGATGGVLFNDPTAVTAARGAADPNFTTTAFQGSLIGNTFAATLGGNGAGTTNLTPSGTDYVRYFSAVILNPSVTNPAGVFNTAGAGTDIAPGCSSTRVPVTVRVQNPTAATITALAPVQRCVGSSVSIAGGYTANEGVNTIRLYTVATGGTPFTTVTVNPANNAFTGATRIVEATDPDYYVEAVTLAGCVQTAARNSTAVTPVPVMGAPTLAASSYASCGQVATLTIPASHATIDASVAGRVETMYIYDVPTGGLPLNTFNTNNTNPSYNFGTGGLNLIPGSGSKTYYLQGAFVQGGNACSTATRTPLTIVSNAVPSNTAAPLAVSRCGAGSVTITVTQGTPAGETVRLWDAAANGNLLGTDNTAPYEITLNNVSATTTAIWAEAINLSSNCSSAARTQISGAGITINNTPSDPTVSTTAPACGPGNFTFVVTMGAVAGTEARLYTQATGGTAVAIDPAAAFELIQNLTATTTVYVTAATTTCESNRVAVPVAVTGTVPAAPTVANISNCGGTNVTFTVLASGATAGSSAQLATNAAFTAGLQTVAISNGQATITPTTSPGAVLTTYYFRVVSGGCTSTGVSATGIVPTLPTTPTGFAANTPIVCSAGAVTFTAGGFTANNFIRLYTVSTGGSPVSTNLATGATVSIVSPSISTNSTFYLRQFDVTTGCESASSTVAPVSFTSSVGAPVPVAATICTTGTPTFSVSGTLNFAGRLDLYTVATGGTVVGSNAPPLPLPVGNYNTTIAPTTAISTTTTYFVEAVTTTPACTSSRVQVVATFADAPVKPVVADITVCGTNKNVTFTATGSIPNPGGVRVWNMASGGTLLASDITAPYELTFLVSTGIPTNGTVVTTYYFESFNTTSGCSTVSGNRTEVKLTLADIPAAINASAIESPAANTLCGTSTATFRVTQTALINNTTYGIRLYTVASGGTAIATTNLPTDGFYLISTPSAVSASTIYYFEQYNVVTGCASATRTPVQVVIASTPTAPTVANVARCASGMITFTAVTSSVGTELRLYTQSSGGNPIATDQLPPYELGAGTVTVTNTYYVASAVVGTNASNGCESARTAVTATINSLPGAPVAQDSARRCGFGSVNLTLNTASVVAGNETRLYTSIGTFDSFGRPTDVPVSTDNVAPYLLASAPLNVTRVYYFTSYNTQTGCESVRNASSTASAIILPVPSQPFAVDVSRCGVGVQTITVTRGGVQDANDVVRLYRSATDSIIIATDNTSPYELTTPTLSRTTDFYVAVYNATNTSTSANLCEGPRRKVTVTVNPGPDEPSAMDVSRCGTGTVVFTPMFGATPGAEFRLWNDATGTAAINLIATNSIAPFTLTSGSIATTTTFWIDVNTPGLVPCNSTRKAVVATVNTPPGAPSVVDAAVTICGPGNVTIAANQGSPAGNTIDIFTMSSGGLAVGSDTRNVGPYFVSTNVASNQILYVGSRNTITGCVSASRTLVSVVLSNQVRPSAPSISPLSNLLVCGGNNATIQSNFGPVQGNQMRLYTVEAGGTPTATVAASPFQFTVTPSSTQDYFVASFNSISGCESDRSRVTVRVGSSLNAPTVSTSTVARCGRGTTTYTVTTTSNNTADVVRLYTASNGGSPIATYTFTNTTSGTFFFVAPPVVSTTTNFFLSFYDSFSMCESSSRTSITLTVNALPETPTADNVGRCSVGANVFTAAMGNPAGSEMRLYDENNIPSPDRSPAAVPTATATAAPFTLSTGNLGVGTRPYYITSFSSSTGCESLPLTVTSRVSTGVATPIATAINTAGCNSGVVMFNAMMGAATPALSAGNEIRLYSTLVGGTPVSTDATAPYMVSTPIIGASTVFYVASYDSQTMCESATRTAVTASVVSQAPITPTASNISGCVQGSGSFTINATQGAITGTEVRLYTVVAGGTPVQTTTMSPAMFTVDNLSATTTYYVAAGTGNNCESARREVMVTVNATPPAPITANATRCGNGVVTFTITGVPAGGTVIVYDSPVGGNVVSSDNTDPYLVTANINTTTNFFVEVATATCRSSRSQVSATISDQTAVQTFVSSNIAVCPGGRGTFTGNLNGFGNELRMYNSPFGGNLVAVANPIISNTTPFPLTTPVLNGTTMFYVSAFDAATGCETARIPVTATVGNPGTPTVSNTNFIRCGGGPATFGAFLSAPTGTEIRLYESATGGTPLAVDMDAPYEVTTPSLTRPVTSFYVAAGAGTCESARVLVTAVLQAGPSLPTASDVMRCGVGQVTFTANMGVVPGSFIRLYDAENGGNLVDQRNSFPYELSTGFLAANTDFFVAVGNSTCETNRIRVRAMVGDAPSQPAPVANVLSVCGRGAVTFLVNMGQTPGAEIRLYAQPQGGSPLSVDNTFPFEVTSPVVATTQSFFVAAGTGACESDRVQVTAVATQAPSAPTANNVTRCGTGDAIVTANMGPIAGAEIRLYTNSTSTAPIAIDGNFPYELATPVVNTNATYFITAATGACESLRVPVSVFVGQGLSAPGSSSVTICGGGIATFAATFGNIFGNEIRLYDVPTGGAPLAIDASAPYNVSTPAISTTQDFFVAAANGSCESARTRVTATVLLTSTPSAPSAIDVQRCGPGSITVTAFMGANPGSEMRLWTAQNGGFLVAADRQAPYELAIPLVDNNVTYYAAAASGQCESQRTPVSIRIAGSAPVPSVSNVAVCGAGSTNVTFTLNFAGATTSGVTASLYTLPFGGTPIVSTTSAPYTLSTSIFATQTFYVGVGAAGCENPRIPVTAAVAQTPTAPTADNVAVCGTGLATISPRFTAVPGSEIRLYNLPVGGSPVAVAVNAPYTLSFPASSSGVFYISSAFAGNCESPRTPVTVSLTSAPNLQLVAKRDVSCSSLGQIVVSTSGSGFVYRINGIEPGNTNGIFAELAEGTYFVTANGPGGCSARLDNIVIGAPQGPASVSASNITSNSATINWTGLNTNEIRGYNLRYRVAGTNGAYQTVNNILGTALSQSIAGLQAGTTYEVDVQAICASGRTTAFTGNQFSTTEQPGAGICVTPTNVSVRPAGNSTAVVSWTPNVSGAVCYILSAGPASTDPSTWPQFLIQHPANSFNLTNLVAGVQYAVQIRTNCTTCGLRSGVRTAASAPVTFSLRTAEFATSNDAKFTVYPNPNNGAFNVSFNAEKAGTVNLQVLDLTGRVVFNSNVTATEGANELPVVLDGATSGIYVVKFRQGNVTGNAKINVN
jgi:large repetitive protein